MNKRLKEIRENVGLTQEAFGNRIGTARNTIAGYETGVRTPSNAVILSICKEFSINEEWLRTGNGKMYDNNCTNFIDVMVQIDKYDDKAKRFIEDYWKLSQEDKSLVMAFMNRFIKD